MYPRQLSRNSLTSLAAFLTLAIFMVAPSSLDAQEVGSSIAVRVARGDANADGFLDHADLRVMMNVLLGTMPPPVSKRDLDVNRDGDFNSRDLLALTAELARAGYARQRIDPTLERAILGDADDDGSVTPEDVFALAYAIAAGASPAAPAEAVDLNRDGRVDEFDLELLLLWELRH